MTLQLHIPDSVVDTIRIPEGEMAHGFLVEMGIALYAKEPSLLVRPENWQRWANMNWAACWDCEAFQDITVRKN